MAISDIPNLPGVPPLKRPAPAPPELIKPYPAQTATGASKPIQRNQSAIVFADSGKYAIRPDGVMTFEFTNQAKLLDHPVEAGGFSTFNKVGTPYDAKILISCVGDNMSRSDFLAACRGFISSRSLLTVVRPFASFKNCNAVNMQYKETSRDGVSKLDVLLFLREVRVTAKSSFTPASSSSAPAQNLGQVSTTKPTAAQSVAASKKAVK